MRTEQEYNELLLKYNKLSSNYNELHDWYLQAKSDKSKLTEERDRLKAELNTVPYTQRKAVINLLDLTSEKAIRKFYENDIENELLRKEIKRRYKQNETYRVKIILLKKQLKMLKDATK